MRGTPTGLAADVNGVYSIRVHNGDVLEISGTGYETQRVAIRENTTVVDVMLKASATTINEVVVTALGIRRQARELGYSSAEDGNGEAQNVCETNIKLVNNTGVKLKIIVYDGNPQDPNTGRVKKYIEANQQLLVAVRNENNNYYYVAEEVLAQNDGQPRIWDGNISSQECKTRRKTLQ